MPDQIFDLMARNDYEHLFYCQDKQVGLKAIICGSANNQLAEERHGDELEQRGIIYAPDYIVNAGGALFNIDSLNPDGFKRERAEATVAHIYETMNHLLALAQKQHIPTYRAADVLAEQRIAQAKQHTLGGFHDWRR